MHVAGGELTVLKQGRENGIGKKRQTNRRWRRHHQHPAQRPVEGVRERITGFLGVVLGKARQNNRGHGDGEYPQRKLHHAIRVIKPGDAAGDQKGRDECVHQQIDLRNGRTERRRNH